MAISLIVVILIPVIFTACSAVGRLASAQWRDCLLALGLLGTRVRLGIDLERFRRAPTVKTGQAAGLTLVAGAVAKIGKQPTSPVRPLDIVRLALLGEGYHIPLSRQFRPGAQISQCDEAVMPLAFPGRICL